MIKKTSEFERIASLPKRSLSERLANEQYVDKWTERLKTPQGTMRFRDVQAVGLEEAYLQNGAFCTMSVGSGKTLFSACLPSAMNSKKAVIFVPPKLYEKTLREFGNYSTHFKIDMDVIIVVKYSMLSSQKGLHLLNDISPDLIVADEAHCLKDPSAARTKRFLKYMKANPGCRFVAMSGTMMNRSLMDYAHFNELALRKYSTVPLAYTERMDWSGALDAKPRSWCGPGALREWCVPGQTVRQAYAQRMLDTQGVIANISNFDDVDLVMEVINAPYEGKHLEAYTKLQDEWLVGDKELTDAKDIFLYSSEICEGFYYLWDWPRGVVDEDWLEARKKWTNAVNHYLKGRGAIVDTEGLAREKTLKGEIPQLESALQQWLPHIKKKEPPKKAIRLGDYVVKHCKEWSKGKDSGIIWYQYAETAKVLQEAGFDVYTPDRDPTGVGGIIACSASAHGTGKNLQYAQHNNLILCLSPSSAPTEQIIGRTHRPGQEKEVTVAFLRNPHNEKSIKSAIQFAEATKDTFLQDQKLLIAKGLDEYRKTMV